jgi:hypothetical protein
LLVRSALPTPVAQFSILQGWRVIFVTAVDLHHPDQLLARIAAALL